MEPEKWPFTPIHITCDGGASDAEDLRLLTGEGIITNEYLQGIQTTICAKLKHPTTIVEFSPEGVPVRTDSELLYYSLRPPCAKLRECTSSQYCYACDSAHALLFFGLKGENIAPEINQRMKTDAAVLVYQRDAHAVLRFVSSGRARPYLEYDCPLLGYREVLFPIFFENRVIGVFFVGEIPLKEQLPYIEARQKVFFAENPCEEAYKIYRDHPGSSATAETLGEVVLAEHQNWVSNPQNVYDERAYEKLIQRAFVQLQGLEETLNKEMELRREHYARTKVEQRITQFRDTLLNEPNDNSDEAIVDLWKNMESCLGELIQAFDMPYAVVFGIKHLKQGPDDDQRLEVVAKVGVLPDEIAEAIETLSYDLKQAPKKALSQPTDSLLEPSLLKGLQGLSSGLDETLNVLHLFPVPFQAQGTTAILLGYYPTNGPRSSVNQRGGALNASMQLFYHIVFSSLSSILAAIAQRHMQHAFRVLGHELGQLTAGLDWLRVAYLTDLSVLRRLAQDKAEYINRDMEGFLRLLQCLSDTAKMVVSVPQVRKKPFLAYGELLFRWKDTYRLEAEKRSLQIVMPYPESPGDPWRPPVNGDVRLLEQVLYNLLNNAVKYSYRGTMIYIDFKKRDLCPESPHVLTVTDYGIGIPEDEQSKIFELYYRSKQAEKQSEAGLGVGLYVARQIALAHGGDIELHCEKVSDYNAPLIPFYLRYGPPASAQMPALRAEWDALKRTNRYWEIVARFPDGGPRYANPPAQEIMKTIWQPTHKITFAATIPA